MGTYISAYKKHKLVGEWTYSVKGAENIYETNERLQYMIKLDSYK